MWVKFSICYYIHMYICTYIRGLARDFGSGIELVTPLDVSIIRKYVAGKVFLFISESRGL